jgi:hypothetical protein
MSDVWKKWEGQIADDKFPLHRFLGTTDHSAVFLTQTSEPRPRKGAIKFISADSATAEAQLSLWSRAAQLSHPNLLPIYHSGRCRVADLDLLYAVMEFAEEDLSQILPQRPLAASEAREMLEPLLNALIYRTSSPPPINSSSPATLPSPSANPASHHAISTPTTLPNSPLRRWPPPPTSGLLASLSSKLSRNARPSHLPAVKPIHPFPKLFPNLSSRSRAIPSFAMPPLAGPPRKSLGL